MLSKRDIWYVYWEKWKKKLTSCFGFYCFGGPYILIAIDSMLLNILITIICLFLLSDLCISPAANMFIFELAWSSFPYIPIFFALIVINSILPASSHLICQLPTIPTDVNSKCIVQSNGVAKSQSNSWYRSDEKDVFEGLEMYLSEASKPIYFFLAQARLPWLHNSVVKGHSYQSGFWLWAKEKHSFGSQLQGPFNALFMIYMSAGSQPSGYGVVVLSGKSNPVHPQGYGWNGKKIILFAIFPKAWGVLVQSISSAV